MSMYVSIYRDWHWLPLSVTLSLYRIVYVICQVLTLILLDTVHTNLPNCWKIDILLFKDNCMENMSVMFQCNIKGIVRVYNVTCVFSSHYITGNKSVKEWPFMRLCEVRNEMDLQYLPILFWILFYTHFYLATTQAILSSTLPWSHLFCNFWCLTAM